MMRIKTKTFLLLLTVFFPNLVFAHKPIYICTLKPFTDFFIEAGHTERQARSNVQEVCEMRQGEGSMFCQRKRAVCKESITSQGSSSSNWNKK